MPIDAPSSVTVALAVAHPHRPWPFPHTLPATLGRITPRQRQWYNGPDSAKEGLDTSFLGVCRGNPRHFEIYEPSASPRGVGTPENHAFLGRGGACLPVMTRARSPKTLFSDGLLGCFGRKTDLCVSAHFPGCKDSSPPGIPEGEKSDHSELFLQLFTYLGDRSPSRCFKVSSPRIQSSF